MLTPGETIERYEVVELLGVGGHATVYRLRHTTLGSDHALKVVHIPRDDIRARLIQEGRIQARLNHPHIVPVTDVLDVGGLPALLMPFVDGPELGRWLEREAPIPLSTVVEVFTDVVRAVDAAHSEGLVHRDLKPGNILMDRRGDRWIPRVTDFGIAKIVDAPTGSPRTRTGIGMGTPAYMAPEQIADAAHVDRRADIFALGCLLYELLTGRRLFRAGHPLQVVATITDSAPVDIGGLQRPVSPALHAVLTGCLEKNRARRLPDCATILALLEGHRGWTPPPGADALAPPLSIQPQKAENPPPVSAQTPADHTPMAPETPLAPFDATQAPPDPTPPARTPASASVGQVDPLTATRPDTPPPAPLDLPQSQPLPPPPPTRWTPLWVGLAALATLTAAVVWLLPSQKPADAQNGAPAAGPSTRVERLEDPVPLSSAPTPRPATASKGPPPHDTPTDAEATPPTQAQDAPPNGAPPEDTPPADPSAAAPPRVAAPPQQPAPSVASNSPQPPRAGILRVNARPWSEVWVDGTHLGRTWQTLELQEGTHTVRLQDSSGRTHSGAASVRPDATTLYCWDFDTDAACSQ